MKTNKEKDIKFLRSLRELIFACLEDVDEKDSDDSFFQNIPGLPFTSLSKCDLCKRHFFIKYYERQKNCAGCPLNIVKGRPEDNKMLGCTKLAHSFRYYTRKTFREMYDIKLNTKMYHQYFYQKLLIKLDYLISQLATEACDKEIFTNKTMVNPIAKEIYNKMNEVSGYGNDK